VTFWFVIVPLATLNVPLPSFKPPFHVAFAMRFI
jgi:hypothetical protein